MCVCVCVCVCVRERERERERHTHTPTDTQDTERERERERERQTDRQTDRDRDRDTHTHTHTHTQRELELLWLSRINVFFFCFRLLPILSVTQRARAGCNLIQKPGVPKVIKLVTRPETKRNRPKKNDDTVTARLTCTLTAVRLGQNNAGIFISIAVTLQGYPRQLVSLARFDFIIKFTNNHCSLISIRGS